MGRDGTRSDSPAVSDAALEAVRDSGRSEEVQEMAERLGEQVLSSEAGEGINVHVLVPARETVQGWFAYSLALAIGYMGKHHPYVDLHLVFNNGTILSEQRTELAKVAMLDGADWTVWFDSDMRFPKDVIERLLAHKKPIVAAGYPTRKPPAIEPTQYKDDDDTRAYTEASSTGLERIASTGFGCIAVHRSVYEAMDPPWFHIPWDEEEQRFLCGEDVYFCRKARAAGFEVLLDHDLSKEIAHIGSYEFTYREANACRGKIEQLRTKRIKIA